MGTVAVWDYAQWEKTFPELAHVNPDQAQTYLGFATLYLRNDGSGPVTDPNTQLGLLNLLVAHFAVLLGPTPSGTPAPGIIGRVSNASTGSVSVTAEYASQTSQSAAFYLQTKYGAMYWDLTKIYRRFMPVPGPQRTFGFPWPSIYG